MISKDIVGQGWVFPPQIGSRGTMMLTDTRNELEQAIHIILTTSPGERVMRPNFGCRLNSLLFAPNNGQTAAEARRHVEAALGMWEPRIRVTSVDAFPDPKNHHCLMIEIKYQVKATHDRRSLVHPFYLILEE